MAKYLSKAGLGTIFGEVRKWGEKSIPTKLSQLTNDNNTVADAEYTAFKDDLNIVRQALFGGMQIIDMRKYSTVENWGEVGDNFIAELKASIQNFENSEEGQIIMNDGIYPLLVFPIMDTALMFSRVDNPLESLMDMPWGLRWDLESGGAYFQFVIPELMNSVEEILKFAPFKHFVHIYEVLDKSVIPLRNLNYRPFEGYYAFDKANNRIYAVNSGSSFSYYSEWDRGDMAKVGNVRTYTSGDHAGEAYVEPFRDAFYFTNTELYHTDSNGELHQTNKSAIDALKVIVDNKVDKVNGKGLSTEDFTTELKAKLISLSNYDDATIRAEVGAFKTRLDTLVNNNATEAIDTFNEIEAFLQGVTNKQSLTGMFQEQHKSIDAVLATKVNNVEGKGLSTNDFSNVYKNAVSNLTALYTMIGRMYYDGTTVKEDSTANNYVTTDYIPVSVSSVPVYASLHGSTDASKSNTCAIVFYDKDYNVVMHQLLNNSDTIDLYMKDPNGNSYYYRLCTQRVFDEDGNDITDLSCPLYVSPHASAGFAFKNAYKELAKKQDTIVSSPDIALNKADKTLVLGGTAKSFINDARYKNTAMEIGGILDPNGTISSSVKFYLKAMCGFTAEPYIEMIKATDWYLEPDSNDCSSWSISKRSDNYSALDSETKMLEGFPNKVFAHNGKTLVFDGAGLHPVGVVPVFKSLTDISQGSFGKIETQEAIPYSESYMEALMKADVLVFWAEQSGSYVVEYLPVVAKIYGTNVADSSVTVHSSMYNSFYYIGKESEGNQILIINMGTSMN